jgi:hypothetical protein
MTSLDRLDTSGRLTGSQWQQLLGPILFATLPYLISLQGIPQHSFDGMIYRVWAESFHAQISEGVLYPRWLPDLARGLGSPTFYFYPPLAFFASAVFRILGLGFVGIDLSMGLTIFFAAAMSALGAFLVAREIGANREDSYLIAVIYTQLPYLYYANLMIRGAFVEFIACCIYPLLLWSAIHTRVHGISGAPWLALFVALMLLQHPPTALVAIPTSLAIALAWRSRGKLGWLFAGALTGAALPAWYLSTALTHQRYAPHDGMFRPDVIRHSLFLRPDVFGDSARDLGDHVLNTLSISNVLLLPAFLATALPVLVVSLWAASRRRHSILSPWVLAGCVAAILFFCHPQSYYFWQNLPLLDRIQFAWRLTSTLSVLVPVSLALLIVAWSPNEGFRARVRSRVALCIAILTAINIAFAINGYAHPQQAGHYELAKLDVLEHRLSGPIEAFSKEAILFSRDGARVEDAELNSVRARATVTAPPGGATVVLRQFSYTGWIASIDGEQVRLHDEGEGLTQVRVPPGKVEVEFRMTRTSIESLGLALSAVGLIALILLFLLRFRRRATGLQPS